MAIGYNPRVVTDGLALALDAGNVKSYNTSGTTWTDLSLGQSNATLSSQLRTDVANRGSLYFDGTTSYAEGGVIEPTYYTLSCTFKATGAPSNNDQYGGVLICNSPQLFNNNVQYILEYSWLNQRVVFGSQTNTNVFATSDNSVLPNKIYKVDAVYDGSTQKIYVNGELVTSRSWTTNPVYPTTENRNIQIGRWGYSVGYGRYFNGYIYEAKVYDRALTADEILQNYIAFIGRFKDPDIVTDGLVLNLDAANGSSYPASGTTWTDLSGNGNNGTLTNGPTFDPISGGSIVFDGTNDYVSVSNVQPGTNDFTITVWVYKNNNISNDYIWDFGANGGTLSAGTNVSGYGFRYYNGTLGTGSNMYTQGTIPNVNEWYEVTITRNSGTSIMYINGQSITSSSGDTHNISSTTLYIGRYGGSTGYEHDGRISSFKIYNRALSAAEIQQNYNALAPRYTRPSIVSDGLVLNLDAGNNSSYPGTGTTWTDLSGNSNNGTLTNGPTYSNGSFSFDGTDDKITINASSVTNLSNGNFTISAWFYIPTSIDTTNLYYWIFAIGTSSGASNTWYLRLWRSGIAPGCLFTRINDIVLLGTDGDLNASYPGDYYKASGRWTYFAFVENNGTSYYYMNGVQTGSASTPTIPSGNNYITIGDMSTDQSPNGMLVSNFSLYQKALSASEIQQNFNALRDRFGI